MADTKAIAIAVAGLCAIAAVAAVLMQDRQADIAETVDEISNTPKSPEVSSSGIILDSPSDASPSQPELKSSDDPDLVPAPTTTGNLAALSPDANRGSEPAEPEPAPVETTTRSPPKEPEAVSEPDDVSTTAPEFDVVRVDPKGQAVVAGRAEPGSTVEIVLNGTVVAREEADQAGNFVSLFKVPVTEDASELTLRTQDRAIAREAPPTPEASPADEGGADSTNPSATTSIGELTRSNIGDDGRTGVSADQTSGVSANVDPPVAPDAASPETDLPAPDTVMAQRSDTASEVLGGEDGESAPVLILPSGVEGQAPTIVQPEAEQLALLQSPGEELTGVRLDRISYAAGGFVDLIGRAGPGNTVRVYVNADFAGQAVTVPAGQWRLVLPGSRVREA
ncbi:MAG: hypothetical protein AAF526_05330, partial [Pseudomonadota bacterium]